ncbi:hypothetical protein CYY_000486 [Polysphondylium violaceum]|uniref:Uncharacterized protein n=1 Tax=Polysphondylium violaceum TaxID=133409 RepID=A0A8J4UX46_9MYCE|nr:hypothetical protein CYY_000486 [Polysphondylium violaceum]
MSAAQGPIRALPVGFIPNSVRKLALDKFSFTKDSIPTGCFGLYLSNCNYQAQDIPNNIGFLKTTITKSSTPIINEIQTIHPQITLKLNKVLTF